MSQPANPNSDSTRGASARRAAASGVEWASALADCVAARSAEHTLTVRGVDAPAKYRFRVSGTVTPTGDDDVEVVNESTVLGTVPAADAEVDFAFSGRLASFRVADGDVAVTVDGDDVAVPLPPERGLPNTVTLRAEGDVVDYRFRVTERVERGPLVEPNGGRVDGRVVRGTLGGQSVHNYFFAGSLDLERATGPLSLSVDVDEIDDE